MNAPDVEALYFGPPGSRLFGWLHRSAAPEVGVALVICNPFGFEEVCVHRGLRVLAEAVAAAGTPVLRFDYAGCGNAAGDAEEGEVLGRWQASVHDAIDAVKRASGAQRVCLFGVRLGALLATLAAVGRDDVPGLLLVAPVVRGRAYLRELTALGGTGRMASPTGGPEGIESAGFLLPAAACDALRQIDLRMLSVAPAPRVLIVERDDLPEGGDWAEALERLGAEVVVAHWPGYAAMVDDPQRALTPARIVEGVIETLGRWQAGRPRNAAARGDWGVPSIEQTVTTLSGKRAWIEMPRHIDIGGSGLFAVLHRPLPREGGPRPGERRAVLMLNSGSVHSIGPNRLWVHLARRWAAEGVCVLRLDIAGIGDSAPRPGAADNVVYSPHAMADVAAALEHLRRHEGVGACHVMGLCSGAYHAFKAATTGLPVTSALMINPLTYFWAQGTSLTDIKDYEVIELADKYRNKLFTREPWQRLLRGELELRLIGTVIWRRAKRMLRLWARGIARRLHLPLRDDLARELSQAARTGVPLRFVFASNAPGYTLLQQESGRALARLIARGDVAVEFVPDADHTFTRAQARERLVRQLDRTMLGHEVVATAA